MVGMEPLMIVKNVVLALHIIGIVALLGGVLFQIKDMRAGKGRVLPAMMHGAWTMLLTGVILVGMAYPLGFEPNNAKITVKLLVLVAIILVAFLNRKKETVAGWVLPLIGGLTVVNILLATVWKS
jgi:uncharacterized membrane protein SirB2